MSDTPHTLGQQQAGGITTSPADNQGFAYLKRDLVRMLGILCHEKKEVQDRTRAAGGIEVVMNMCVIDERNPCKSVLSDSFCFTSGFPREDLMGGWIC